MSSPAISLSSTSAPLIPSQENMQAKVFINLEQDLIVQNQIITQINKKILVNEFNDPFQRKRTDNIVKYAEYLQLLFPDRFTPLIPLGFGGSKACYLVLDPNGKTFAVSISVYLTAFKNCFIKSCDQIEETIQAKKSHQCILTEISLLKELNGKNGIVQTHDTNHIAVDNEVGHYEVVGIQQSYYEFELYEFNKIFYHLGKNALRVKILKIPHVIDKICLGILKGLNSLEEAEITHGDIHVGNILISLEPEVDVRLIDFNFGSRLKDIRKHFCLCPQFLAPEINKTLKTNFRKYNLSMKAQVYSFGACLYYLCFKDFQNSFNEASDNLDHLTFYNLQSGKDWYPNKPITDSDSKVTPLAKLIHDMLQIDPNNRPTGVEAYQQAQKILGMI